MDYRTLANLLQQSLNLQYPPVAMTRTNERPASVEASTETVPSACTFWRRAETSVFYAGAEAHMNCPIGAMVMGFELSEAKSGELMNLVGGMCELNYLKPEEVELIPTFQSPSTGAVYGPLADFPVEPDVALVWTTPFQAMLLQETTGATTWTGENGRVFGRPACSVLPSADSSGGAAMSLGCMGMRTFTEIAPDLCLIAIPRQGLEGLAANLERTLEANQTMASAYRDMAEAI